MADNLHHTLIRVYDMSLKVNHGNVVVAEVLRRRVDFWPFANPGVRNTAGAVLIDAQDALGDLADAIGRGVGFLILIAATDELIWVPIKAEKSVTDYWTVEMVPWIEYARASMRSDEEIIRKAHSDE